MDRVLNSTWNPLGTLYKLNYLNVIIIDVESFHETGVFKTFNRFQKFKEISSSTFKQETVQNVQKFHLKVSCFDQLPFSKCYKIKNKVYGIGRTFHLINNFVRYINGSIDWAFYKPGESLQDFDLWTNVDIYPINIINLLYPLTNEILSNFLEETYLFLALPKPDFIANYLYLIKPFSKLLWVSCLGHLTIGSIILLSIVKILKRKYNFWMIFDHQLRTLLAQSYLQSLKGFQVYLLAMFFGFIITVWYSSVLGSFLTTYIREPKVKSIIELKELKIKIGMAKINFQNTYGYKEISDIIIEVTDDEMYRNLVTLNRSCAVIVNKGFWELSNLSNSFYRMENFYLENTFLRHIFHNNSFYLKRFNRFIGIVKDSGLYEFWKERISYEMPRADKSKFIIPVQTKETSDVRVLKLNYFLYPFWTIGIGCVCAIFVFIFELTWTKMKL